MRLEGQASRKVLRLCTQGARRVVTVPGETCLGPTPRHPTHTQPAPAHATLSWYATYTPQARTSQHRQVINWREENTYNTTQVYNDIEMISKLDLSGAQNFSLFKLVGSNRRLPTFIPENNVLIQNMSRHAPSIEDAGYTFWQCSQEELALERAKRKREQTSGLDQYNDQTSSRNHHISSQYHDHSQQSDQQ